VPFKKRDYINQ